MTTVFGNYAQFYDTLYQEKDYAAECDFIEQIFVRYAGKPIKTILDLGCGTGGHALPLAQRGYHVTGVDRSEQMLASARAKSAVGGQPPALSASAGSVVFHQADIRHLDLGQTFDAVISMFAVISYMTSNDDLVAAFRTARRHLQPGGLFIFDAWSGLAVLTERPQDRYKIVEANGERIIRFVHPELKLLQHVVDVNYKVLRVRGEQIVDEVDETHPMRFLFPQEITYHLTTAGFQIRHVCPFLRLEQELEREWELAVVAEAT